MQALRSGVSSLFLFSSRKNSCFIQNFVTVLIPLKSDKLSFSFFSKLTKKLLSLTESRSTEQRRKSESVEQASHRASQDTAPHRTCCPSLLSSCTNLCTLWDRGRLCCVWSGWQPSVSPSRHRSRCLAQRRSKQRASGARLTLFDWQLCNSSSFLIQNQSIFLLGGFCSRNRFTLCVKIVLLNERCI